MKKLIAAGAGEFKLSPSHLEKVKDKVSATVPDEAYTVRELYERFASGLMTDVGKESVYYGGEDPSDDLHDFADAEKIGQLDIAEMDLLREEIAAQQKDRKSVIDDVAQQNKAKREAEQREYEDIRTDYKKRKASESEQKKATEDGAK